MQDGYHLSKLFDEMFLQIIIYHNGFMLKTPSAQKKKIKLSQPTEVEAVYNRLINTSFEQSTTHNQNNSESYSLFEDIKFPSYKVRSHDHDLERLGEITQRCISYKDRFTETYQQQMKKFQEILKHEKQYVYGSCESLIKKIQSKRDKLIEDLVAKEYQVKLYWQNSLSELDNHMLLISKSNMENMQVCKINKSQFDDRLGSFTNLVSTFYRKIRVLEIKVAEDLDSSQFLQIKNQAKVVSETKLATAPVCVLQNKSFTFNQSIPSSQNCSVVVDKLSQILKNQKQRDMKIQQYKQNMK